MEWLLQKIPLSFQKFLPAVRAEESEEIQDPQVILREECGNTKCSSLREKLEKCNARVNSKKQTSESCHEEMVDFVNCIDHCAAKTLFSKLK